MKISDGKVSLEIEKRESQLLVFLTGDQFVKRAQGLIEEKAEIFSELKENYELCLSYQIPLGAQSLAEITLQNKNRLDKLRLAQLILGATESKNQVKIPFLHPENIFVIGSQINIFHQGLVGLLAPQSSEESLILSQYKALILSLFVSGISYEQLLVGQEILQDPFCQKIAASKSVKELSDFINSELLKEDAKIAKSRILVSKNKYRLSLVFSLLILLLIIFMSFFTYSAYQKTIPKQNAIISAQAAFIRENYSQAQKDLQEYAPNQLPKMARYILASASVNLSDLTYQQKKALLNNISPQSDSNSLDYWIYTGRGEFKEALNLAQNLGDNQLSLLAYSNLYEATKLNNNMAGSKKQELLKQYSEKIQALKKELGI